jgi:hypothetical protein
MIIQYTVLLLSTGGNYEEMGEVAQHPFRALMDLKLRARSAAKSHLL